MLQIDTRGLSFEQALALMRQHGLVEETSPDNHDITDLHFFEGSPSKKGYVKVMVIWLKNDVGRRYDTELGAEIPAEVTFTLWDGREVELPASRDLHGFVRGDEHIDWGLGKTLDLMR